MNGVFFAAASRCIHSYIPPGTLVERLVGERPWNTACAAACISDCAKCITTCSISPPIARASSRVK